MVTGPVLNYLLVSRDAYRKKAALDQISNKAGIREINDINVSVFYASSDSMREACVAARTLPFGADKRIIIVKEAQDADKEALDELLAYLAGPCPSTVMVLDASSVPSASKGWHDIMALVKTLSFDEQSPDDAAKWLMDEAAAMGKPMARDAARALVDSAGTAERQSLSGELAKLAAYAKDKPGIDISDVAKLTGKPAYDDIFELARAVAAKDPEKALGMAAALMKNNVSPSEILGVMAWHFRKIYLVNNGPGTSKAEALKRADILMRTDMSLKRGYSDPQVMLTVGIAELCRS